MERASRIVGAVALTLGWAACGTGGGRLGTVPPQSGNDRAPVALMAGPDELATRAAAEREAGQLARAERFSRWALALDPEHPGALVEAARVAVARGDLQAARRRYALAASEPAVGKRVARERGKAVVALAAAELDAGRIESAGALLEEIEQAVPEVVGDERPRLATLHGALADVLLGRGLERAGRAEAERAKALGAPEEATRLRLVEADVLAAPDARPRTGTSGLGLAELKVTAALEHGDREVERALSFLAWARALSRSQGRFDIALWAADKVLARDRERADAWIARAELLNEQGVSDDGAAVMEALRQAGASAVATAAYARVAHTTSSPRLRVAAATAAIALMPGSEGAVRAALELAAAAKANVVKPAEALEALATVARALPEAWPRLVAPALAVNDAAGIARVLGEVRAAGRVDALAHSEEAKARFALGDRAAAEAAFAAAIAARPGLFVGLELARFGAAALRERGELLDEVRALGPAQAAYLEALMAARNARSATLDAGLGRAAPFEAAYARALLSIDLADPPEALRYADEAVRLAGSGGELGAAQSLALRVAFGGNSTLIEPRAQRYLALDPASIVGPEALARGDYLMRLLRTAMRDPELASAIARAAWADEEAVGWYGSLDAYRATRSELAAKLERWDEADAAWIDEAKATPWRQVRAAIEDRLGRFGSDLGAITVLHAGRLAPDEMGNLDPMVELVRVLLARSEPVRARRLTERLLDAGRADALGSARMLTVAQMMMDAGELELAARGFERVVALGDSTPRAYGSWLRACLRQGDDAAADEVARRWSEARSKGRPLSPVADEIAKIYLEVGRVGRAIEILEVRAGERLEPTVFASLSDLYVRAGRRADLTALARRLVSGDARYAPRLQASAVQRLLELGAAAEAQPIIDEALAQRPSDQTMLGFALTAALATGVRGEPIAERAKALLLNGAAIETWERVINELRAAGQVGVALEVLRLGRDAVQGSHRLLLLRARTELFAGDGDAALQDWAEALARAPSMKDALDVAEPILDRGRQLERLAQLESRALALMPGRADATLMLGRALIGAGRVDEGQQVFGALAAETDRAHGLVAAAWYDGGHLSQALEAWSRVEPLVTEDAAASLGLVAGSLARRGEASRLDTFVRLYLQSRRGAAPLSLLPVAQAYRTVGRPDEASRWLERADRESPSPEGALELMRWRLASGDRAGALAAAERVVARRLGQGQQGRLIGSAIALALDPVALELERAGEPGLARDLALRIGASQHDSAATRMVAARAMLAEGDLAGALPLLEEPIDAWKQQRDLIGVIRDVIDELVAHGHLDAALAIAQRVAERGGDRELTLAAARIAARVGDAAQARWWAGRSMPFGGGPAQSGGAWLAGDVLASERMARSAEPLLALAARQVQPDAALMRVALTQVLARGGTLEVLDAWLAEHPRVAGDRTLRAVIEGQVASALAVPSGAPARAAAALSAALGAPLDPNLAHAALTMASFSDRPALEAAIAALGRAAPDATKARVQEAAALSRAQRPAAASALYAVVLDSDGGDGQLALDAFQAALLAGDEALARRWVDKALGPSPGATATLRLWFAGRAAALGAVGLAAELLAGAEGESWRKSLVQARNALTTRDLGAFREAIGRRVMFAPDEAVARVESAELVLVLTRDAAWRDEAARLLEPLLREEEAPAAALELALAASRDPAAQRRAWEALQRRFPGAPGHGELVLDAVLDGGDGALLGAVLATMPSSARRASLRAALEVRWWAGEPGPSAARVIEVEAMKAPEADVDRAAIEVLLPLLASDRKAAVRAAEAVAARAPWSAAFQLQLAGVEPGRERAAAIVREVLARPAELGLFDAEGRWLAPHPTALAWEAWARVAAAEGKVAVARIGFERALTVAPEEAWPRLWWQRAALGEGDAYLRACVLAARAPWSSRCASRL